MKRLALVGTGKMGKLVEQLAPEYGFQTVLKLDSRNNEGGRALRREVLERIDVAIEFSSPQLAPSHLKLLAQSGIAAVTGTTGWFEELPAVSETVTAAGTGLVWSPNFSIGVAVFRKSIAVASALLAKEDSYGAWAWEIHHDAKRDSPSGTLLQIVETMQASGYSRSIDIAANRAGKHPGTHEIGFDSAADTITFRHTARNREGFARGALKAAQWLGNRKGVYTFDDVLFGESS